MIFWGDEGNANSYKAFDSTQVLLQYWYNYIPNNNATVATPANNQVVTTTNPVLRINPATDPDNDPLEYNFVLRDQTGTVLQSTGYTSALSMTVMNGILQDSQTYNWEVWVKDQYYYHQQKAFTSNFKVDFRLGKDASQIYNDIGPVSVSLQTGNAYTSVSSHSMNALGGNIGIGLEYNSPSITREGLEAKFFNNTTWSGSPVYTRIDGNVDFNWSSGSPAPGIVNPDNYSASWSGFFVAPSAGNYKFKGVADDISEVRSGVTVIAPNNAWSGPIALSEGQAYPIEMRFVENTGLAAAEFWCENPSGVQAKIPSNLLRTPPQKIGFNTGLTGHYFIDNNGSHDFNQSPNKFLTSNEPIVQYDWGANSPVSGGPVDGFLARFEGYITPPTTGTYTFTVGSDDGTRLWVNNQQLVNRWLDQGYTEFTSTSITLSAGQSYPIKLEYYELSFSARVELKWSGPSINGIIENKYLSPEPRIVPVGWKVTGVTTSPFDTLKVLSNGNLSLITSDGAESLYTYTNGGYKPPPNEDAWIIKNADNTFTLTDTNGGIYVYASIDNSGFYKIRETSSPYDDKNPAGLKYEYQTIGGSTKLRRIIDSVDQNRFGTLYYKGDTQCTNDIIGTSEVPQGYLCAFGTTDGRITYFTYLSNQGFLNHIIQPGNARTEFTYSSDGQITSVRTPAMVDVITAGLRTAADSGSKYTINYDSLGRVTSANLPSNTGASSLSHTIEYLNNRSRQHLNGGGNTEPNGYTKYIEYDNLYRTTKVCDKTAQCSLTEWDTVKDLVLSTTDAIGLKSTTIYDADDKPIETFGPAPTTWYGADRKPTAAYLSQVPRTQTNYDETLTGPAVTYYNVKNNSLFGSPRLHQFGIRPADRTLLWFDSTLGHTMPSGMSTLAGYDGYGLSITGKMTPTTSGSYTFKFDASDALKVWVDDTLVADNWANRSAPNTYATKNYTTNLNANQVYRMRIDWAIYNASPRFASYITGPNIATTYSWPNLKPGYNLATSNKVFDSTLGDLTTTTTYSDPAYSLVSEKTLDPTGLNYKSQSTFEAPGTGFFRPLTTTTAGGSVTSYTYYGNTETRLNPCTNLTVSQAGFPKSATYPNGMIVESIYDSTGRVTASRINTEAWNCTT